MRSYKNHLIVALALLTLTAGYTAWQEYREIARLKEQLAAKAPEVVARKRAWSRPQTDATEPGGDAHSPGSQTDEHEANLPDLEVVRRRGESAFRSMMENPEYQKLMAITQKGRLDGRYAALFKQLNLTPEQLEKFKNLLLEKQNAMIDVMMAARDQGLNPRTDREAFQALLANTQTEIDNSIRSAIGDQAYASYENYERTMPYRGVVDQLTARLSYGTNPLTSAQSEAMVNILASTNSMPNLPAGAVRAVALPFGAPVTGRATLNSEAMNRAQGILTPDQYAALQQLQQEQQAQAQMRNLLRQQLRPPTNPAGNSSPPSG